MKLTDNMTIEELFEEKELLEKRVINGATMRYLERKTAN